MLNTDSRRRSCVGRISFDAGDAMLRPRSRPPTTRILSPSASDRACRDRHALAGALGIEAVSRGAAFAMFVDNGAEARALLRNNVEALGLGGTTKVYRRDATL